MKHWRYGHVGLLTLTFFLFMTIMLTKIHHFYYSGVSRHLNIYNTLVLSLGKSMMNRHQSYVLGLRFSMQECVCVWNIIAFMVLCNFSDGSGRSVIIVSH